MKWEDFQKHPSTKFQFDDEELEEFIASAPPSSISMDEVLFPPLKGTLRTRGDDNAYPVSFRIDKIEWDGMHRIVDSNLDPRYGHISSNFVRNAIAEAIETHDHKFPSPEGNSYLETAAWGIAEQELAKTKNEREVCQKLVAELKTCKNGDRIRWHPILLVLYKKSSLDEVKEEFRAACPELEGKWPDV